ncbi:MAG TPA: aromatic ring-hydroxylating dioxygenase subunit alpha [Alphaproteobacteria bacterium]|nr:aromatic ring-hydroxylating dioxygenase subunit alpha [Alphaproteobacteria bacterium]
MDRSQRVALAKRILDFHARDVDEMGEESWETDVGRFTDQKRFELEKKEFFLTRPQLIAYSADFPEPGDYYATEIAGKPIILTRNKDGVAHAFLNACRHRGVKLAEGCGNAKGFVCPYHGWTYSNDGDLTSVPSRSAFDADQLAGRGLIKLPLVEKHGVVLVHPDPNGSVDYDEFFGPEMGGIVADYKLEDFQLVGEYKAPARINWKHAVDGGLEGYHVPFLHPNTVGPMTLRQFMHMDFGMHHTLVSPQMQILELKDKPESEWPEDLPFGFTNAVFPNTVVGGSRHIMFFQRSEPGETVGTCTYIFRTYGPKKNATPETDAMAKYMSDLLLKVSLEEDMVIQSSAQIQMEAGAVPSIIMGRREVNIVNMHKNHDRLIGHNVEAALGKNEFDEAAE